MNAEPREACILRRLRRKLVGAVVEIVGIELDLLHAPGVDLVDLDRQMKIEAPVEESELERQPGAAPARTLRFEADIAMLVVGERLQLFQRLRRLRIRLRR